MGGGEAGFVNLRVGNGSRCGSNRCGRSSRCWRGCGFWRFGNRGGGGNSSGRCASGTAQGGDEVALFDLVADFDGDAVNGTGGFCRDFHRGFVGFKHDDGLAIFDAVARLDEDFDDVHRIEIANVGDAEVGFGSACGGGDSRCFRGFCHSCGRGGRGGSGTAQGSDEVALFDFVADLDGDAGNRPGDFCRDFHGGFVGFQHDHRLAVFDAVARFDQDFDDINCIKITNVGYADFIAHYSVSCF